jgi:hypothetical protein
MRLSVIAHKAMEMPDSGKHGKRYSRFPPFPLSLEIALRFPHSHRHDRGQEVFKEPARQNPRRQP